MLEKGGKCWLLLWEKRRTLPGGNDQDDGDKELEGWGESFHYVGPGKRPIGGIKGVFRCSSGVWANLSTGVLLAYLGLPAAFGLS